MKIISFMQWVSTAKFTCINEPTKINQQKAANFKTFDTQVGLQESYSIVSIKTKIPQKMLVLSFNQQLYFSNIQVSNVKEITFFWHIWRKNNEGQRSIIHTRSISLHVTANTGKA